jgi:hypothetical protein
MQRHTNKWMNSILMQYNRHTETQIASQPCQSVQEMKTTNNYCKIYQSITNLRTIYGSMLSYPYLPMSFNSHGRTILFPCLFFLPPVLATTQLTCAATHQPARTAAWSALAATAAPAAAVSLSSCATTPHPQASPQQIQPAPLPARLPIFAAEKEQRTMAGPCEGAGAPWPGPPRLRHQPAASRASPYSPSRGPALPPPGHPTRPHGPAPAPSPLRCGGGSTG